jgi:hypothetical protein
MNGARAIENLNDQFKGSFDVHGQVPTKGLVNTRRFALGAVFVYQLTRCYRQEHGLDLRVGVKPFLKAASANYDQASVKYVLSSCVSSVMESIEKYVNFHQQYC